MTDTCKTCAAFLQTEQRQGLCRLMPPTPIFMGMGQNAIAMSPAERNFPIVESRFPLMLNEGWCYQYKVKR